VTIITFSREAHSGTRDLARLLADRLGYRYVSRDELTRLVNARSGLARTPSAAARCGGRSRSGWSTRTRRWRDGSWRSTRS